MADKIPTKTEYSVAGDLLYRCLHFQLQENTHIFKVKSNLFKQLCSFACSRCGVRISLIIVSSHIIVIWVLNSLFGFIIRLATRQRIFTAFRTLT